LRYEGCPGLWHSLLWLAQKVFHVPYSGLGAIGAVCAAGGAALVLLRAPFPRPLRWLLLFSYYMVYQYAVIARPYVLLPLLAFASATFFKDTKHPERITIALALLANVSVHGTILAACIGAAYLWQAAGVWAELDEGVRGRYVLCVSALVLVFLFLLAVLKPTPDVEAMHEVRERTLPAVGSTAWHGLNGAFFDYAPLTLTWLALVGAWCWMVRGAKALLLPVLILAMAVFYGFYGWVHHQGTIFIAAIAGLWILWPTSQDGKAFSARRRWTHQAMVAGLTCLLGYQAWNAAVVVRNDYRYPYCGAEDAAKFLKSVGADRRPIFGYLYGMVALEAYFDHNIQGNRPTAHFHHGAPFSGVSLDPAELEIYAPEYVVLPCWYDPDTAFRTVFEPFMHAAGYSLVHISDGYLLSKRGWDIRQVYFIYRRNSASLAP
jgi:hypothetical protein